MALLDIPNQYDDYIDIPQIIEALQNYKLMLIYSLVYTTASLCALPILLVDLPSTSLKIATLISSNKHI